MAEPYSEMSLYTLWGERKYISPPERDAYYQALDVLVDPKDRTFCELIYWTGCRISEALGVLIPNIDVPELAVIIRSLKKHGKQKGRHFRAVPVPDYFIEQLDRVHGITEAQRRPDRGRNERLWGFSRTTAWRRQKAVMDAAGLTGVKACSRGLRHSMGVNALGHEVPLTRIQRYLGHSSLDTTALYREALGAEDRAIARRMWEDGVE